MDKGYDANFLARERLKIRDVDKERLLEDTTGRNINLGNETCLVLDYSLQKKDVEGLLLNIGVC